MLGAETIAVEISTLTQHVTDDKGTRPRLSDDLATAPFANALNDELGDLIPDELTIGLVLSSPILLLRKTKAKLGLMLREYAADLSSLRDDRKIEINGNKITVYLNRHGEAGHKKVSAAITNCSSNPNIHANVLQILEDRIVTKARKCERLDRNGPIWLAGFQKILLVYGDRSVPRDLRSAFNTEWRKRRYTVQRRR